MELQNGVMHLQPRNATDCWQPPEARREDGKILSKSLLKDT
jgi:hypothetical protein